MIFMFELLEHTADVGVKGYGKNKEEAFQETAKAMYSIIANLKKIQQKKKKKLKIEAENIEELLYKFLNELIFITNTENLLFSGFKVKIKEKNKKYILECIALGEKMNEKKHELYSDIKAATFTSLRVGKEKKKYFAQCILDV